MSDTPEGGYSLDLIGRMLVEMQRDIRDIKGAQVVMGRDVIELKERVTRLEISHQRLDDGIREAVRHLRAEAERR